MPGWKCKTSPDIEFPARHRVDLPARRGADRDREPDHPARRSRRPYDQRRQDDQFDRGRRQQPDLDRIRDRAPTSIRRSTRSKTQIDQVRGELPDGILEPQVFKVETSSDADRLFRRVGRRHDDRSSYPGSSTTRLRKRLLTVAGLAEVSRGGGVDREILVMLDPAQMQSLGVTASQVNQTLRALNINAAGGRAEIAGSRQSVRVLGNAKDAYRTVADPDSAWRRAHGQAGRHRRCVGRLTEN